MIHVVKEREFPEGLWWVDDTGRWNAVDPRSADSDVGNPIGGSLEHQQIAYRHLGMAKVQVRANACKIAWDVKHVEDGTFSALVDFLRTQPRVGRIQLNFYFGAWQREVWPDSAPAWQRMSETYAFREVTPFQGVTIRNVPVDDGGIAAGAVRRAFEAWERGQRPRPAAADPLAALKSQLLLFRPRQRDGRLHFTEVGRKSALARVLGPDWAASAIGKPFDRGQADHAYEDRVTAGYSTVMETGEPRLDQIRAVIRPGDGEPVWASYQRLLMRNFDADGSPHLACFSYVTQDLSIPFPAALPDR